jgi:adenylate cyclase
MCEEVQSMAAQKQKRSLDFLIPVVAAAFITALNFLPLYRSAERRVYDLLLHLRPAVPERPELLFLDIDDTAIAEVGQFPWSRDVMAEGLILLREMGAAYAVFDIEYVDPSPRGVNLQLLDVEVPELFEREFADIQQNVSGLFAALQAGSISLRDAEDYVQDLASLTDMSRSILLDKVREIARDNDAYLGAAARLFGNAYFTVNLLPEPEPTVSPELKEFALEDVALEEVRVSPRYRGSGSFPAVDIRPAIRPILEGGAGAGFVNVVVDSDGVRRRIALVREFQGRYFAQLALAPLLDWLGRPEVRLEPGRVVLAGARLPEGELRDISIPLEESGLFLINWPKKSYSDSFRHLTWAELVGHRRLEQDLVHNLKIMEAAGYLSYFEGGYVPMDAYRYAEKILQEVLQGGDPQAVEEYVHTRQALFDDLLAYLQGPAESRIMDQLEAILASEEVSDAEKVQYREIRDQVPAVFGPTRKLAEDLSALRSRLAAEVAGSFCIIGWTATSTTDIGVNPFAEEYVNVGTHAAVANTILQGRFLDELPWWYAPIVALVVALLGTWAVQGVQKKPLPSILVAIGFVAAVLGAGAAFFVLTGRYLNLLTPVLTAAVTFIVLIAVNFLREEREKTFIRNAFSHYLSNDVINELVSDPEKLNLGGEKKYITAMFTDVRGFSSVSEKLDDPQRLVKLLNAYLTEMSNIILDQKGTIDKYEGDAIIAFFGAPVDFRDHARRACLSAVRMKKVERYLNDHFLGEGLTPEPLFTRIGINTGDMVVGNMGTAQKMDYTIMGNSVNLASRLEGVNKQYGTWILVSEETFTEAGEAFVTRQMDPVRVMGIEQPVRLYELIDERAAVDDATLEAVELFHRGQALYEERRFEEAIEQFRKVQAVLPGDGPSEIFIKRCQKYQEQVPPGFPVFKMETK